MKRTRREFIKDAAVAGAAVAAVDSLILSAVSAEPVKTAENKKCPFFDQPLMCGGQGSDGKFKCE